MESEYGYAVALSLGLLLGLKHATDADHVVAVATIVKEARNVWRGLWIGASWGLGHTAPLVVLGVIILLVKEAVLEGYESIAPAFEFGVGIMLVLLGIQVFWNLRRGRMHLHEHTEEHQPQPHVHIHATHQPDADASGESTHGVREALRPTFRPKSFFIGIIHGLAGSAAVMLVLLPKVSTFAVGLGYIVTFGLGTVLSMAGITLVLGVPFALSDRFERVNLGVIVAAGVASVALGALIMSEIAMDVTIIPF